jgi:hypothetical protein
MDSNTERKEAQEKKSAARTNRVIEVWNSGGPLEQIEADAPAAPPRKQKRKYLDSDMSQPARLEKFNLLEDEPSRKLFRLETWYLQLNFSGNEKRPPPHFPHVLQAIKICGENNILIPAWVTEAITKALVSAETEKNWNQILGKFDHESRDAFKVSEFVGACVLACRNHGIPINDALRLIAEEPKTKTTFRQVELAWELAKVQITPIKHQPKPETTLVRTRKTDGQGNDLGTTDASAEKNRVELERKSRDQAAKGEIRGLLNTFKSQKQKEELRHQTRMRKLNISH